MRRALVATALLAACGAKSPLPIDASAPDAPATDRPAPQDLAHTPCNDGPISLQRNEFVALLAVDRSGSMNLDLQGNNGVPRRWDVLRAVLPGALAAVDPEVRLGALLYPAGGTQECAGPAGLAVPFGRDHSRAIAQALAMSTPTGRTPTFAALVQAERLLAAVEAAGPRAVILATDGGPNCNAALDGDRCVCAATTLGPGREECRADPSLCLDDARAVAQVQAMAQRGVATYVIGIDGDRQPALVDVLRRLAVAGGRPNPAAGRAYYSVQRPEDLDAAVRAVTRALTRCTLTAGARPPPTATVTLRIAGAAVARDADHVDGWDWSTADGRELALFGRACDAVAAGASVDLDVRCAP
ncbi:MAG: vWA domain-containing protein [Polyangiales bacterium]